MNNKEEAEKSWTFKAIEKSQGLSYFTLPYIAGISDFKTALIQAVDKAAKVTTYERNHNSYMIFSANNFIDLINETKPL